MKRLLPIFLVAIILAPACRKDHQQAQSSGLEMRLQQDLRISMPVDLFEKLDFNRIIKTQLKDSTELVRVGFKNIGLDQEFVLLTMSNYGWVKNGKIVKITGGVTETQEFEGKVMISDLEGTHSSVSPISKGHIQKVSPVLSSNVLSESASPPPSMGDPFVKLPEVIIVSVIPQSGGGISTGTYINLMSLASSFEGGTGAGGSTGWYSNLNPFGGSGGGVGSVAGQGYTSGEVTPDVPIEFEAETIYQHEDVDIKKMFKCFDQIPSTGATYSIILNADLPSNTNPSASADINGIVGGHTFLTVSKKNGGSSITQSFGFFPLKQPKWTNPFGAVTSTIKNDGSDEINASVSMDISEEQFQRIKINAIVWAGKNYQLADYNCSDYAIDIFNSVRTNPITVGGYDINIAGTPFGGSPGVVTLTINKSPQMLFYKLDEMKKSNTAEAANIRIDQSHDTVAPESHGECD